MLLCYHEPYKIKWSASRGVYYCRKCGLAGWDGPNLHLDEKEEKK